MNDTLGKLSGVQIDISDDYKTGILSDTGMKNLGLNIQEITQYASQLASVSDSVGMTGESTLALAKSMTMLAGDVSSLFNVDYSNVATNIQAVLQGQSRAGYKYGWDTTLATLQKYADELNLSKPVSEMTQLEKRYLRVLVVLRQSKVSWGDLANTINSPSNMIRQFKTNLKETGMVLGQLFIPMLQNVLPVVNGVTIGIKRLLTEIAGFFGVKIDLDAFGQGYNELEDETDDLTDGYDDLASAIEEAKSQLLGFDEVNKLQDTSTTVRVGTEDNTIDLTDEIVKATEEYEKVWNEAFANMELSSSKWADRVEKALEGVGDVFEDFAVGDFFKAGEDVSQLVIDFNNFIAKAIKNIDSEAIGKNFAEFFKGINWSGVASGVADVVASTYESVWDFGRGFGESLGQGIYDFFADVESVGWGAIWKEFSEDVLGIYEMPEIKISVSDALNTTLDNIETRFTNYNEIASKYLELSANYDSLSEEDKALVKTYGEELGKEIKGITGYIDDITGAWTGTNKQLEAAIQNTKEYYLAQAYESTKQTLYADIANAQLQLMDYEEQRNSLRQQIIDDMTEKYGKDWMSEHGIADLSDSELLVKYSRSMYRSSKYSSQLANSFEQAYLNVESYEKAIIEAENELENITELQQKYEYAATTQEEKTQRLKAFLEKVSSLKVNPKVGVYVDEGLNTVGKFVEDVNKWLGNINNPTIKVDTESAVSGTNIAVDTINAAISGLKVINPSFSTENASNGMESLRKIWENKSSDIEKNKPAPGVDSSTFNTGISSLWSTFSSTLGKLTSIIKVEADNTSLSGLAKGIKEFIEKNAKFKLNVSGAATGALAGISVGLKGLTGFATGGHPNTSSPFIVGEEGPEIMGGMFGKPTVANGNSITDGIRQAAYEGMKMALAESGGNRQSVNVTLQGDSKKIFRVVQTETNNYVAQTGQSPFNI